MTEAVDTLVTLRVLIHDLPSWVPKKTTLPTDIDFKRIARYHQSLHQQHATKQDGMNSKQINNINKIVTLTLHHTQSNNRAPFRPAEGRLRVTCNLCGSDMFVIASLYSLAMQENANHRMPWNIKCNLPSFRRTSRGEAKLRSLKNFPSFFFILHVPRMEIEFLIHRTPNTLSYYLWQSQLLLLPAFCGLTS